MKRNKALAIGLGVLVVAGWAIWGLTDRDVPGPREETVAGTPEVPRRAPAPVRQRTSREPVAEAPAADETPDVRPAASAAGPGPDVSRPLLRVILVGLDSTIPAAESKYTVTREAGGRSALGVEPITLGFGAATGATFTVPLSNVGADWSDWAYVNVEIDRFGYVPAIVRAQVRIPRKPKEMAGSVEVPLRPAGFVTGIVQDDRFSRVPDADVGAFVEASRTWVRVDATKTNAAGEFRLRLVPGVANLVAVAANAMQPESSQVTGVAREATELVPFTLRPGLQISGSVRFADGRAAPDAVVAAQAIWSKTDFALGKHALAYRGGVLFDSPATAPTQTGLFSVGGLVAGDYDVSVRAPHTSSDLLKLLEQRVSPPYERLAFVIDGGHVAVEVTFAGRPVPGIVVSVGNAAGGVRETTTREREPVRVLVIPGTGYDVEVNTPGFEPEKRGIVGPPAGQEVRVQIALRGVPPKVRLVLAETVRGEPEKVESADVRFYSRDDIPSDSPDAVDRVAFHRGSASTSAPWPGPFEVVVTPPSGGFLLPARVRADVKPGNATEIELVFPHGGRLTVAAHDAAGGSVTATFRLLTKDGTEVLAGDAGTKTEWLLAPAAYRLELTRRGGPPVEVPIGVYPDRTSHCDPELPDVPKR